MSNEATGNGSLETTRRDALEFVDQSLDMIAKACLGEMGDVTPRSMFLVGQFAHSTRDVCRGCFLPVEHSETPAEFIRKIGMETAISDMRDVVEYFTRNLH